MARRRIARFLLRFLLVVIALLVVGVGALAISLRHPLPTGTPGPAADALARSLAASVNSDAWARTGAVRWSYAHRERHLWDRQRQLARVEWGDHRVLVDLKSRHGRAWRAGRELVGDEQHQLVDKAWAMWVNDAFWLNPLAKLFDDGVTRSLATLPDGTTALLIRYGEGGKTPGDSYLWIPGADGRPRAWRLWVSILPIGGLETSWQDWVPLSTGAFISTRHKVAFATLDMISDLAGAATLAEIEPGPDPFAALSDGK